MTDPLADRVSQLAAIAQEKLALDASAASAALIKDKLQLVAAEMGLEWLAGVKRFENQSQQAEHWLSRLYDELYPDEQPDGGRIYSRLDLPLSRAQYLARLLLAHNTSRWRDSAREEARVTLEGLRAKAAKAAGDKRGDTQFFDLSLTRGAYEQLIVRYDQMVSQSSAADRVAPLRRKSASGALVWFTISADAILRLLPTLKTDVATTGEVGA